MDDKIIRCHCKTHLIEVTKDEEEPKYSIILYEMFDAISGCSFWYRLKTCYLLLRHKKSFCGDILLDEENFDKLIKSFQETKKL